MTVIGSMSQLNTRPFIDAERKWHSLVSTFPAAIAVQEPVCNGNPSG